VKSLTIPLPRFELGRIFPQQIRVRFAFAHRVKLEATLNDKACIVFDRPMVHKYYETSIVMEVM